MRGRSLRKQLAEPFRAFQNHRSPAESALRQVDNNELEHQKLFICKLFSIKIEEDFKEAEDLHEETEMEELRSPVLNNSPEPAKRKPPKPSRLGGPRLWLRSHVKLAALPGDKSPQELQTRRSILTSPTRSSRGKQDYELFKPGSGARATPDSTGIPRVMEAQESSQCHILIVEPVPTPQLFPPCEHTHAHTPSGFWPKPFDRWLVEAEAEANVCSNTLTLAQTTGHSPAIERLQSFHGMVMRKFVPNTENDEEKAASTAPTPEPGGERLDLSSTTFDREKSHTTQPTDGCVLDYLRHTELEKKQIIVEENTLSGDAEGRRVLEEKGARKGGRGKVQRQGGKEEEGGRAGEKLRRKRERKQGRRKKSEKGKRAEEDKVLLLIAALKAGQIPLPVHVLVQECQTAGQKVQGTAEGSDHISPPGALSKGHQENSSPQPGAQHPTAPPPVSHDAKTSCSAPWYDTGFTLALCSSPQAGCFVFASVQKQSPPSPGLPDTRKILALGPAMQGGTTLPVAALIQVGEDSCLKKKGLPQHAQQQRVH
ncbi:hypothetical protein Anapl_15026 [Anas platyrhynchos]|uniref:Uncharacterized protein n=1 Tax=Anas platyrhynchos TaxID=8839 RepID=R0KM02_ANAPL|nr:hypothetical protein Anapl_15026 [Anas platyrhynchos]